MFLICFADVLQSGDEIVQNLGGHHNAVAVGAYFLSNAYNAASRIALQVNEESLAVGDNFFGANDVFVHSRVRLSCQLYTAV